MKPPAYSDQYLRDILRAAKSIAMVGLSPNSIRPSWFVGNYMHLRGYRIFPVNPVAAGQTLFGQPVVAGLADIAPEAGEVHMLDLFRRSEHVPPLVEEAIEVLIPRGLKTVWMQIGVINRDAARMAEAAGLNVVMNKCPKMEYQRLMGELRMGGINTGIISSRLP